MRRTLIAILMAAFLAMAGTVLADSHGEGDAEPPANPFLPATAPILPG